MLFRARRDRRANLRRGQAQFVGLLHLPFAAQVRRRPVLTARKLLLAEIFEPLALTQLPAFKVLLLVQVARLDLQSLLGLAQLQREFVRLQLALLQRTLYIAVLSQRRAGKTAEQDQQASHGLEKVHRHRPEVADQAERNGGHP